MFTVRKKFTVEMAHQLERSYSQSCTDCIHGHSYIIELFFTVAVLNDDGMVIDFGQVKEICKPIIDQFDHALVLPRSLGLLYGVALSKACHKLMLVDSNPTAEWMVWHLWKQIYPLIPSLSKVRIHETSTGWAEFSK